MATSRLFDRDLGWNAIRQRLAVHRPSPHVAVGILGEAAADEHGDATNVDIATVHEFGSDTVPERSFIRATVDAQSGTYRKLARTLASRTLAGLSDKVQALALFGQQVEADIKNKIRAGINPPLAPQTIEQKGSSTPLIDTGQLVNAITSEVRP